MFCAGKPQIAPAMLGQQIVITQTNGMVPPITDMER